MALFEELIFEEIGGFAAVTVILQGYLRILCSLSTLLFRLGRILLRPAINLSLLEQVHHVRELNHRFNFLFRTQIKQLGRACLVDP